MTTRPMTKKKATFQMPDRFGSNIEKPEDFPADAMPGQPTKPQKIIAGFLNPACEHEWLKLEDDLQTLESEGKIIWKCRTCAEITNTYNWRTP